MNGMMDLPPLRAPYPWFGSKRRVARQIWRRFGDVPNFVEPCAGSMAVLLARPHPPKLETSNDIDPFSSNFWRATSANPEEVARYADYPVLETDLFARHLWLVNEGKKILERLQWEPEFYDAKIAGWWLNGACLWIGSGWCIGKGPHRGPADADALTSAGVKRQIPHLASGGQGVEAADVSAQPPGKSERGVNQKMPHVGSQRGVHRKLPLISHGNVGVHRHRQDAGGTCAERHAFILGWLQTLRDRLRRVRVCCGDWRRVCTPAVTTAHGLTACLFDPPYVTDDTCSDVYAVRTDNNVARDIYAWCLEHGSDPLLRIAFCAYEGHFPVPEGWSVLRWSANGGYGNQGTGRGRENSAREIIMFSPHCLNPETRLGGLFSDEPDLEPDADEEVTVESDAEMVEWGCLFAA